MQAFSTIQVLGQIRNFRQSKAVLAHQIRLEGQKAKLNVKNIAIRLEVFTPAVLRSNSHFKEMQKVKMCCRIFKVLKDLLKSPKEILT